MQPIFITGIGTDIGKTLVSAIVVEALQADYWKPIQAGYADGTDAELVSALLSNKTSCIHPELYKLSMPASPHIAAGKEGIEIDEKAITQRALAIMHKRQRPLVIEGAGGLLVPLANDLFVADLALALQARVIVVSRNYLGSINHSLLTAAYCKQKGLDVAGWIFNDDYLQYENEIAAWSGYPSIGSVQRLSHIDTTTVAQEADKLRPALEQLFNPTT